MSGIELELDRGLSSTDEQRPMKDEVPLIFGGNEFNHISYLREFFLLSTQVHTIPDKGGNSTGPVAGIA